MPKHYPKHYIDWTHAYKHRLPSLSAKDILTSPDLARCAKELHTEANTGILPYLTMPYRNKLEEDLHKLEDTLRPFKHMVVLGIGGSALGAKALQKAFFPAQDRPNHNGPWIWIADNVDATTLEAWMTSLPLKETIVVIISKSGGTIETMAQYFIMRKRLQEVLGEEWKKHVLMITDEQKGELRAEATNLGLLSLPVPDYLGGRYSVLSAVGLLPAAFLGIAWKNLLKGALDVNAPLTTALQGTVQDMESALARHPAWHLAVWNHTLMQHGYDELIFFCYIPLWNFFGAWFSQLWAESLGKAGKGSMPISAVGVTDQHSTNQMFLDGPRNKGCLFLTCPSLEAGPTFDKDLPKAWQYLHGQNFGDLLAAEALGTRMALTQSKVPLAHLCMANSDEEAAGSFMGLAMTATILTGKLLGINPVDQPAVELGKRLANARLGASGYPKEQDALTEFLEDINTPSGKQLF